SCVRALRWFQERGRIDNAVKLYHKAGDISTAAELAFAAQMFDALHEIVDELDAKSDPALVARCGDFFMEHEQFDKSVSLYVIAGEYDKALDLALEKQVKITEDMAEKMTVKKSDDPIENKKRYVVVGDCCGELLGRVL